MADRHVSQTIAVAMRLHEGQYRLGKEKLPYVTHVLSVALLVARYGGDDDVIAAAILHDTIEDTAYTETDLRNDFGDRVTSIVLTVTEPKHLPWAERKKTYREQLAVGSVDALLVSACDLIHNLQSVIDEAPHMDEAFASAFLKPDRLEVYEKRVAVIEERLEGPAVTHLQEVFASYKTLLQ